MSIQSVNPATEEIVQTFEPYSESQVEQALEQAHTAFQSWRETTFAEGFGLRDSRLLPSGNPGGPRGPSFGQDRECPNWPVLTCRGHRRK